MTKVIQVKMEDELIKTLDSKALSTGLDRSSFIRLLVSKFDVIIQRTDENVIQRTIDTPPSVQRITKVAQSTIGKYTEGQAKAIVVGWYVKNPDKDMTKKLITEQAKELANNPELIKFYT